MSKRVERRTLLRALLTGSTACLAGCSVLRSEPSEEGDPDAATLAERIDELEGSLAEHRDQVAQLQAREKRLELEQEALDPTRFDESARDQFGGIAREIRDSVVVVGESDPAYDAVNGGTGWVYDDGIVATNAHVVDGIEAPMIETSDGTIREGTVRDVTENWISGGGLDVALVSVDTDGLEPIPVESDPDIRNGDPLLTLGHPGAIGRWVSSLGAYRDGDEYEYEFGPDGGYEHEFGIEGPESGGNSGSPVVNASGSVVGIYRGVDYPDRFPSVTDVSRSRVAFERPPRTGMGLAIASDAFQATFENWTE